MLQILAVASKFADLRVECMAYPGCVICNAGLPEREPEPLTDMVVSTDPSRADSRLSEGERDKHRVLEGARRDRCGECDSPGVRHDSDELYDG